MSKSGSEVVPCIDKEKFIGGTWLKSLSPETLQAVAKASAGQRYADGHCLFRRGDNPLAFYMVVEGAVRFTRVGSNGKEMILDIAVAGAAFGEISIFGNKPRGYTANCTGETTLLAIAAGDLRELFEQYHDFRWKMMERLCHRINHFYDSFEDYMLRKLRDRIAKRIVALARAQRMRNGGMLVLDAGLSQENLASMFGISRQSLSKQLQEWRDAGWIDIEYGRIIILDIDALNAVAQGLR